MSDADYLESIENDSLLHDDFGVQPGIDLLTAPSKQTAKKHQLAGTYHLGLGLSEIARYGGYNFYHAPGNTDPWVRQALKTYDSKLYESLFGFTRRGEGVPGMYKSLFKYDKPVWRYTDLSEQQQKAMKRSVAKARDAFRLPVKYQPLDWHEVGQYFRTDTSAGVSFPGKKKGEVMDQIYTEGRWLGHRMKQGGKTSFDPRFVRFPPALAASRGHLSSTDEVKTRLVWIYPAEMLMVEGLYAPVMYKQYQSLPNGPLLLGKSSQRLYTEWLVNYREGEFLHGLDFSGFDTGVAPFLIKTAFDILHDNVDWLNWHGKPTSKRSRQKWRNVWDGMVWYFIHTPILMPDGRMFRKHHGVPSGSWFTQLIDSIVNYILVEYLSTCQNIEIRNLKVLGDDSAFRTGRPVDLEQASADVKPCGMELHPEKCDITLDPTEYKLLGFKYKSGRAYRATIEWFKMALYPESVPPSLEVSLTRLVGLWLGGAMWDLQFCDFFRFYQTCYECPSDGWFSKDTRRWLEIVFGGKAPRGWTVKTSLFWRSIFYTL